ncbi:MAG: hypothetical protein V2A55_02975 [Candidatus Jorgensenbacteria bacterium]
MFKRLLIFNDKPLSIFTALSFLFLIIGLALVYFNITRLTSPIVLHFDNVLGIDFFGERNFLWFVWLTGLFVVIINFFLGKVLFYRERILSYLVFGTTLLFSLLTLVAISQIISLN